MPEKKREDRISRTQSTKVSDRPRMSDHPSMSDRLRKPIAENRRARHEYLIIEEIETGIALAGTEVKSLRLGNVQLSDGYARISNGELWIENVHIGPYAHGNRFNLEEKRRRKLLAHRREINKLGVKLRDAGVTLVPLRMYFKGGKVKLLLGVARGKKAYDKRQAIKERDSKRAVREEIR